MSETIISETPSQQSFNGNLFKPTLPKKQGDRIQWGNLKGGSLALAISQVSQSLKNNLLVVVPSMAEADRLEHDIKLFLKDNSNAPEVLHFADWETLPYDNFSPHQDIISERMRTLYQLIDGRRCIVVVSAPTLLQRLPPQEYVIGNSLVLKKGDILKFEQFKEQLAKAGYHNVDTVYQHGEFAVRGSLLDIFPMGSDAALRIELFDEEVETLREFDPETQRTIQAIDSIDLLPAKECPLDAASIALFRENWHARFDVDHRACPVYQDVSEGLSPAGVEYYLPLFFQENESLLNYLPTDTVTIVHGDIEQAVESFLREVQNRYESRKGDIQRPILEPKEVFLPVNQLFQQLKNFSRITAHKNALPEKQGNTNFATETPPTLHIDAKAKNPLNQLENLLYTRPHKVLFCAESPGRKEVILEQLKPLGLELKEYQSFTEFEQSTKGANSKARYGVTVADWDAGLLHNLPDLAIIAESQLFGMRIQQRRRRKAQQDDQDAIVKNLTELKMDAPVVHIDHGVGRYKGLQTIEVDNQAEEFLVLEYADQAKLYVPVANLHVISRYSGAGEELAPLHKLGSEHWSTAKRKAAEKIRDVAAELLEIYAKRKAKKGRSFKDPREDYALFSSSFPFEETPDQEAAIAAVRDDLFAATPMDRLVCGDVGFGKTEVAMRAAFIAVQNGQQVVILVPTTLLAQQHYDNFKDRFSDWPVNIDVISRFRTTKETSEIRKRLEAGKVDIVIGTHKLLQKNIKTPNLGLLIIDEEHRFGVRQKEALKALKAEVDILTMTATPIPRTLNMAMNSIRDLSIIATPPAKRLSIKTFVRETDDGIIKEAIMREILRGGQVYFLHNEVKTIEKAARELAELVPEARIQIGHGQMRERELEAIMSDFHHKRFNVLVCTTIIETGIDIPSANTIIIQRADKFGLAQLHQLRGRVGRSHHQAYAYLLTPPRKVMTADALKRLDAISEAQDLGAGFTLASHDLEIRGAGELLGEEQSGQMQTIGFSLYMEMLDRAVKSIQKGEEFDFENDVGGGPDVNLRIPALIPEDYLPDVHTRLILYKRIASSNSLEGLEELQVEMIDRFGLLPEATKNLMRITKLKIEAEKMGIVKIEANREQATIEFAPKTTVEPMTLVKLIQNQPQRYRLQGATHLKLFEEMEDNDQRIKTISQLLQTLSK